MVVGEKAPAARSVRLQKCIPNIEEGLLKNTKFNLLNIC
jgi:hypothetical protein